MDTPQHLRASDAHRFKLLPIRPRRMNFPFGTHIPRRWCKDSALLSQMINSLNLLFPAGERYFMRSVKHYLPMLRDVDPALHEQARGFMGQEVRHGIEHERFFATLEAQGYELERFLKFYETRFFPWLETSLGPELLLSGTAALEHYTATFGELALRTGLLDQCDPDVAALLKWHACEEIEHKTVAFDVMMLAAPSQRIKLMGFVFASAGLFGWWAAGLLMLMAQERALKDPCAPTPARELAALWGVLIGEGFLRESVVAVLDYLRPDFHPSQHDNLALAQDYLSKIGQLGPSSQADQL